MDWIPDPCPLSQYQLPLKISLPVKWTAVLSLFSNVFSSLSFLLCAHFPFSHSHVLLLFSSELSIYIQQQHPFSYTKTRWLQALSFPSIYLNFLSFSHHAHHAAHYPSFAYMFVYSVRSHALIQAFSFKINLC